MMLQLTLAGHLGRGVEPGITQLWVCSVDGGRQLLLVQNVSESGSLWPRLRLRLHGLKEVL